MQASDHALPWPHGWRPWALVLLALLPWLHGCDEKKKEKERPQSQVAARVGAHEITLAQIRLVLEQQQPPLRAQQLDDASRQVLARLIDQRLLVDEGERLEIDREPRVRERLDAARREVIARAVAERIGEGVDPPTPDELAAYYRSHPELFEQRRIFMLQELAIEMPPQQIERVRQQLQAAQSIDAFVARLQADGHRHAATRVVRAAEQFAPAALQAFARLHDGESILTPIQNGVLVSTLIGSRAESLTLDQASPVIAKLLLAERQRKRLELQLQALHKKTRIEFRGRFAQAAPPGASAAPAAASAPKL